VKNKLNGAAEKRIFQAESHATGSVRRAPPKVIHDRASGAFI